jgi:hypothetical protein
MNHHHHQIKGPSPTSTPTLIARYLEPWLRSSEKVFAHTWTSTTTVITRNPAATQTEHVPGVPTSTLVPAFLTIVIEQIKIKDHWSTTTLTSSMFTVTDKPYYTPSLIGGSPLTSSTFAEGYFTNGSYMTTVVPRSSSSSSSLSSSPSPSTSLSTLVPSVVPTPAVRASPVTRPRPADVIGASSAMPTPDVSILPIRFNPAVEKRDVEGEAGDADN